MMTANDEILNASIRHMVWLERFKSGQANKVLSTLDRADADLIKQISERLVKIEQRGYDLGPATTKRLNDLLNQIRDQRAEIARVMYGQTRDDLFAYAAYEADFQGRIIEAGAASVGADIKTARPSMAQLNAAVTSQPFQGRLLRDWYRDLGQDSGRKISDAVRMGIVEGQTTDQIVRRIRGTKARNYADGVMAISRRNADSIVRTATAHVAGRAKDELYKANADILQGVKFVATLDGRTTLQCQALDGQIFQVDSGPRPPLHFNCRSAIVGYLGPSSIKGLRSSETGPVPDDLKYSDWLKLQPKGVQDEILGKGKGALFRAGMPIDRFVDKTGKEYTLPELKRKDAEIWSKAFE